MTAPLAAVTGGTGFLGRYLVAALAAEGWRVRLLARRDPVHPLLEGVPMEVVLGDLDDPAALARLVRGAGAVVHAAGLTKAASRAVFLSVNRDGAARVAEAVARGAAPGARCVLVSSQAARQPELSAYAASKRAGEDAFCAALGADASWVVVRPCVIYGPWDREGLALLRLARGRFAPVPVAPEPRIAMVHARDAAAAIAALCRAGAPRREVFEITDGEPRGYAWSHVIRLAGRLIHGREPRLVPVPDGLMIAAGRAADAWAALGGRRSIFGHGKSMEILHRDWSPDPARALPAAVWAPGIGLEAGLRETIGWWMASRAAGRLAGQGISVSS
jgi:nucleoside-diphosphate-sugar epimerase